MDPTQSHANARDAVDLKTELRPFTWAWRRASYRHQHRPSELCWPSELFSEKWHLSCNHSGISQLMLPQGTHVRKPRHRQRFPSCAGGCEKWEMCMANRMLRSFDFKTGGRNTCMCGFACKESQFLDLRPITEMMLLARGKSGYLHNYSWLRWLPLEEGRWRGGRI